MDVQELAPLLELPGVDYYSFLYEPLTDAEKELFAGRVTDLAFLIKDYSDTAAIIANLDLMISVDTGFNSLMWSYGSSSLAIIE